MKKRAFVTLLAAAMTLASVSPMTAMADDKIQIDFWFSGGKTAAGILQQIVDDYNASQDKYNVVTTTQADYDETYQKLQAGIAGKTAPDVALLDVDKSLSLSDKNLVSDLTPFFEEDQDFQKDDYLEVFFDEGTDKDGKVFALPAYGTTQVLYYNIEAFKNAGVDPAAIKTWQDLADAAKKITSDSMVGWEPMWGADNLIDAAFSNGASELSEDGKTVTINDEKWVEVWESFRKWIHDDKIMKVNSGGQGWEYWYNTIDDVLQDKAGGYTGSSGDQADLDFTKVGALEQPGFGDNPSMPMAEALELVMVDSSSDEEKAGVYDFMKYFTAPEQQATWSIGTGYVAVRKSVQDVDAYKEYAEKNPQILVPLQQAMHGHSSFVDPTNGKIYDALVTACDEVELENVPAQEALDKAQKAGQAALDDALSK